MSHVIISVDVTSLLHSQSCEPHDRRDSPSALPSTLTIALVAMMLMSFAQRIYCIVLATFVFSFVAPFVLEWNSQTAPLGAWLDSTRDWLMQGATTFCFIHAVVGTFMWAVLSVAWLVVSLIRGTNQCQCLRLIRAPTPTPMPAALEGGTALTRDSGAAVEAPPLKPNEFELSTANKVIFLLSCIALICYEFDRQAVVSREKPLRDNADLAIRFLLEGIPAMKYSFALPMLFVWLRVRSTAAAARRVEPVSETAQPGNGLFDGAHEAAGTNEKQAEDGKESV
ncbi:hypothetical protein GGX14DRAFT_654115 [Mycena pura]|uniref:Uncharacterized protein n=1 Tax=Mycena pura TaxID=153505 RepID=A0AAD6VBA7_9AGAR|nr:hypothetical protein GGX14DRAFT_654115 [Mycena pura]